MRRTIDIKPWMHPLIVAGLILPIVLVTALTGEILAAPVALIVIGVVVVVAIGRFGSDSNVERRRR